MRRLQKLEILRQLYDAVLLLNIVYELIDDKDDKEELAKASWLINCVIGNMKKGLD